MFILAWLFVSMVLRSKVSPAERQQAEVVGWRDGWRDGNWSQDGNRREGTVKWERWAEVSLWPACFFLLRLCLDLGWTCEVLNHFWVFLSLFLQLLILRLPLNFGVCHRRDWGWHTYWKSCLLLEMPVYLNISFNSPTSNNWLLTNSLIKRITKRITITFRSMVVASLSQKRFNSIPAATIDHIFHHGNIYVPW